MTPVTVTTWMLWKGGALQATEKGVAAGLPRHLRFAAIDVMAT
jgi:hypothetical protein